MNVLTKLMLAGAGGVSVLLGWGVVLAARSLEPVLPNPPSAHERPSTGAAVPAEMRLAPAGAAPQARASTAAHRCRPCSRPAGQAESDPPACPAPAVREVSAEPAPAPPSSSAGKQASARPGSPSKAGVRRGDSGLPVQAPSAEWPDITVETFTGRDDPGLTKLLQERLEAGLIRSGCFRVVVRPKLDAVLREPLLGRREPAGGQPPARLSPMRSARYVLSGAVLGAGRQIQRYPICGMPARDTSRYVVKVKVVDTETQRQVFVITLDGSNSHRDDQRLRGPGDAAGMAMAGDLAEQIVRKLQEADFLKTCLPAGTMDTASG